MKQKVNLSLDVEVADSLKTLSKNNHKTVSQWVTDKVVEETKSDSKNERIKK